MRALGSLGAQQQGPHPSPKGFLLRAKILVLLTDTVDCSRVAEDKALDAPGQQSALMREL